jgi:hypothetical protein
VLLGVCVQGAAAASQGQHPPARASVHARTDTLCRPSPPFPPSRDLGGYPDAQAAAARRETAARAITALMQRDHAARARLVESGGVACVLELLDSEVCGLAAGSGMRALRRPKPGPRPGAAWGEGRACCSASTARPPPPRNCRRTAQAPGGERVQFYMASLLANLVLDREAMATLQALGHGPPLFRTTLRLLGRTLSRLKEARAAAAAATAAAVAAAPPPDECGGAAAADAALERLPPAVPGRGPAGDRGPSAAELVPPGAMSDDELVAAVALADACAQGMWGSTHYCMEEPLQVTQASATVRCALRKRALCGFEPQGLEPTQTAGRRPTHSR